MPDYYSCHENAFTYLLYMLPLTHQLKFVFIFLEISKVALAKLQIYFSICYGFKFCCLYLAKGDN